MKPGEVAVGPRIPSRHPKTSTRHYILYLSPPYLDLKVPNSQAVEHYSFFTTFGLRIVEYYSNLEMANFRVTEHHRVSRHDEKVHHRIQLFEELTIRYLILRK